MGHVYAARAVLPKMVERGGGYLLNTVSAAGFLSSIGDSAYSATKHAALGFAEGADADGIATPEQVADLAIDGIHAGQFMITPHPEVVGYLQHKANNYDRWIGGMRKLRRNLGAGLGH